MNNSLPDIHTATQNLSAEEYKTYLQQVDLADLTLEALDTSVNRDNVEDANSFALRIERDFRLEDQNTKFPSLLVDYMIRGVNRSKPVIRMKVTYRLNFTTESELPVDFFVIYGNYSADMQVWPFLRELASSLTMRMAVPKLVLPLLTDPSILQRPKTKSLGQKQ